MRELMQIELNTEWKTQRLKIKKRSRNVKEVPTERLRTIPSVLFPIFLQVNIDFTIQSITSLGLCVTQPKKDQSNRSRLKI